MKEAIDRIYQAMRSSEMNDWVGGSDPQLVGANCFNVLARYFDFNANSRVLDFGCGIGRVSLAVLSNIKDIKSIVGLDIMPQVVEFCRSQISAEFNNAKFHVISGSNDHYDQFVNVANDKASIGKSELIGKFGSSFDSAYAFSVFTHVEEADFRSLLRTLYDVLEPGGQALITAFILSPFARKAIAEGACLFPFGDFRYENDGAIFVGNPSDRLSFIGFDLRLIDEMVHESGLTITRIEYGAWNGSGFSSSLQDVIICRKPIMQEGEIKRVPTVARPPRE